MDSLSPEGSLNEEDISVHRQISIDGDNEDERQVLKSPGCTIRIYVHIILGYSLCVMAGT